MPQTQPSKKSAKDDAVTSVSLFDVENELGEAAVEYMQAVDEGKEAGETQVLGDVVKAYLSGARDKRDKVADYIRYLEFRNKAAQEEIERLQKFKKVNQNARDRIREYVLFVMQAMGMKKLEGNTHNLFRRKLADSVVVENADAVPRKFCRKVVTYEPDKKLIKEHLSKPRAKAIPGCLMVTNKETTVVK